MAADSHDHDEHVSEKDVVKALWQVEDKLQDSAAKNTAGIIAAIKASSSTDAIITAINASTAAIVAAIMGGQPPLEAVSATLTYTINGGTIMGAPVTGVVGNTATPTFAEASASGLNVAPIGPVVYASDNPAIVSVDPNSGVATLLAAGTANVSGLDQGNSLTDTVAFTVSAAPPPVAVSASLNYTLNASRRR